MFNNLIKFIRHQYQTDDFIPLHAPVFAGREQDLVSETISSTFVSSVGAFVNQFETGVATYTGAPRAIAVMNGTAALHMGLLLVGVDRDSCVITQPLTFVATCNAISYCGAEPIFVDVDFDTMGLSPIALEIWLTDNAVVDQTGICRRKHDNKAIRACLPMHSFGHPVRLDRLVEVCARWSLPLVEDAAESFGSLYKGQHTGTFGQVGTISFNGNKIITTGGGGMILANDDIGVRAKHLTTTAKQPSTYEYFHDEVGYNYRMPNLNAALGCAQLEQLDRFVLAKRALAAQYEAFLAKGPLEFFSEPADCCSNYWLNAVICEDRRMRDALLAETNGAGVATRPIWTLMSRLPMYESADCGDLGVSEWLEARVVNLPSSVISKQSS